MNDRYLYRAKRIDNGERVIGNLIDSPDGRNAISETSGDWSTVKARVDDIFDNPELLEVEE